MLTLRQKTELRRERSAGPSLVFWVVFAVAFLYSFLLALELLTTSFGLLAQTVIGQIIGAMVQPLAGLCVGIITTATVQSSSATTSVMVALVGAGTLSLEQAVPFVLGANIGTTFTSSLLSLSHINTKKEFRRGFAAGLLHTFFNLAGCVLFFPLETQFHLLTRTSQFLAGYFSFLSNGNTGYVSHVVDVLVGSTARALVSDGRPVYFWCAVGLVMLFACIFMFRAFLKIIIIGDREAEVQRTFFGRALRSFMVGTGITAFIHSSTVTTSLCVPLAATGKVNLKRLFPFIIGANVGTTVTALIAAVSRSEAAVALALSHFLFNGTMAMLVLPLNPVRDGFISVATSMAREFAVNRLWALLYLIVFYFILPLVVVYFSNLG